MKKALLITGMLLMAAGGLSAATLTETETATETGTGTVTGTVTETITDTITVTGTDTPTVGETATGTTTPEDTNTPTATLTGSDTATRTPTGSASATPTETKTVTVTVTGTVTRTSTSTRTVSPTFTITGTASPTATVTVTLTPYITPTVEESLYEKMKGTLYPNPVKSGGSLYMIYDFNDSYGVKITLYTLDGRKAKEIEEASLYGKGRLAMDTAGLAPGVYIYKTTITYFNTLMIVGAESTKEETVKKLVITK